MDNHSPRLERRRVLHRISRRYTLLLSGLVGLLAGLVAVLFRVLIQETEQWRGSHSLTLLQNHPAGGFLIVTLCALLGASAAVLTREICPEASGSGIPQVKAVLMSARTIRPIRTITVKLLGGLLALASGMSLGREGPTVHLGAACADLFGKSAHLPGRTRRALIAAGAGAGLAAAFNAPLAGFLFIMEELRREMSHLTYGNALITAISSVAVTRLCLGYNSTFVLPDTSPLPLSAYPIVMIMGVVAALTGMVFNRLLLAVTVKKPPAAAGGLLGAFGGIFVVFLPQVTGGGVELTRSLLRGEQAGPHVLLFLCFLLALKLTFTVASYATGVPGGIFAPVLTMGALQGYWLGLLGQMLIPELTPSPARMAVIGMAAMLTASVRTPLTGVVLIVEMTGQYHILYSLLLASFVAYALSELLKSAPIYDALLSRDLLRDRHARPEEARVLELTVEPGSRLDRARLDRLNLPNDLLVAIIEREDHVVVPHGSTRLEAGDFMTIVAGPLCKDSDLALFVEATESP